MSATVRSESFHLVGEQIAATLGEAHVVLESFAEGEAGAENLELCANFLHAACGALQIAEVYGASLLAEEMEITCRYLGDGSQNEQQIAEGIEALSRAVVQLPAYIDRVMAGSRDIPLVLLPLLNDLRAVRGNPLLSESTLLLLNVNPPSAATQNQPTLQPSGENIEELLGKLRPQFQLGLLGWIKGGDVSDDLRRMAKVAAMLEGAATTSEVHQLWWVVGGVLEGLIEGGLEPSVALKRLIGQADREIKKLQAEGEAAFAANAPTDLINNLLYYVARAKQGGERIDAIRGAFNLSGFGPGDEQVEELREQMSAPNARLMKTVADAIREDLSKAKDVLDIYVRTGMQESAELEPQIALLRKISDTLGVLGLGALREIVRQRSDELQAIFSSPDEPMESDLVALAASLLEVESRLDSELLNQVQESDADTDDAEPTDADFLEVASAVLRECMVNLTRIKESITQVLEQPSDSLSLDTLDEQLRGISAGLVMLGKTRAVDILNRIGDVIRQSVGADVGNVDIASLNRLADSIVSLEYYMETLQAGRKEPVYMLEDAERSLAAIVVEEAAPPPPVAVEVDDPEVFAKTLMIDPGGIDPLAADAGQDSGIVEHAEAEDASELARTAFLKAPVIDTDFSQPDPELLEIFIEEAREEIAAINRHFPVWCENRDDEEALITVRRSFHTLKGSGRMVGAARIGEYSWNIEALLNKVISKTVETTLPLIDFLKDSVAALPQLLEELETGTEPETDLGAIAEDAVTFTEGELPLRYTHVRPDASVSQAEQPDQVPVAAADLAAAEAEPEGIDPVLLEILGRETAAHIGVIRAYLETCLPGSEPFEISAELHHACHTLHGSITMANATEPARLTAPLYGIIEPLYRRGEGLGPDELSLLSAGANSIELVVAQLTTDEGETPAIDELEARLRAAAKGVGSSADVFETAETANSAETAELPQLVIEMPVAEPAGDFDAEIAEIFAEEAAELLESSDTALALLAKDGKNKAPLEEIQRHLHTLKGGARMAGVINMGDFSHELESLLSRINQGGMGLDSAAFSLLQASIDELHRMLEQVPSGAVAAPGDALMARLGNVVEATMMMPALKPDDLIRTPAVVEPTPEEKPVDQNIDTAETAELPRLSDSAKLLVIPEPKNLGELARELTSGKPPAKPDEQPKHLLAGAQQVPVPDLAQPREMARVDSAMLEDLLNNAGEISISHSRMNQQVSSLQFNLEELAQTVQRLQGQLRNLEMETEAQILFQHQSEAADNEEFDPLELDRYSSIQQLSRGLAETANDVSSIKDLLQSITSDTETILLQQARTTSELQDMLMRTRMVPFDKHVPRLSRLVRQQAQESGKQVELVVEGSGELDRQVMDKMLPPFEHMLRNAIIHGIETPDIRVQAAKAVEASIVIRFTREGSQVLIEIEDDGAGINLEDVKQKAQSKGLVKDGEQLTDEEAAQLILQSGLSTAGKLTQSAGRGIGMDVVVSEVSKLGGTLAIETAVGKGCKFIVRLPYTLAITQAFIVRAGNETFALPLPSVEGVVRIARDEFIERMSKENPSVEYGGNDYNLRYLGSFVGLGPTAIAEDVDFVSVILVQAGKNSTALVSDEAAENREIVVKPMSPLLAGIRGVAGATILGDGRVVIILDAPALVRTGLSNISAEEISAQVPVEEDLPPLALVVDDSITMRRVTQRLLERKGMRVITAKDGVEALEVLQDHRPDIVLLDVEMPRMDGYEFAGHVRNNPELKELPIIMITSRTGEKHRARAIEIGINDYLGKPYQEAELLEAVRNLLGEVFNKLQPARKTRH
jgi:chemosensory pili system protein ChpA (sensor histidine kinase/response regulator)